jgi:hypothetical protein
LYASSLWTLQHLYFGPDVAADYSDRGENRDPGRRQKTIDKGDAIRERPPLNGIKVPKRGREERHNEGDRPWKNLSELALISARTIFRSTPCERKLSCREAQVDALENAPVLFANRAQPSFIGMEACDSAHYWARELKATGHDVLLMPPS